jgi:hypothetical protein
VVAGVLVVIEDVLAVEVVHLSWKCTGRPRAGR